MALLPSLDSLGHMNAKLKSLPVVVWHHRLLGGFWTLLGLIHIGIALFRFSWTDSRLWVLMLVSAAYAGTGIGFISGRTWARRALGALLVVAALFFLDMLLMFGWVGNRPGVWLTTAALGIIVYSLLFLLISAVYRPKEP